MAVPTAAGQGDAKPYVDYAERHCQPARALVHDLESDAATAFRLAWAWSQGCIQRLQGARCHHGNTDTRMGAVEVQPVGVAMPDGKAESQQLQEPASALDPHVPPEPSPLAGSGYFAQGSGH
mmetsp:Transcript_101464/g.327440  ORF Transcript_101464/g.327440 Transcript_101464/m.327440 type:complete len:122 (-) Transcript_101464:624-989(-)